MKKACKLLILSVICLLGFCVNSYAAAPKLYKMPNLQPSGKKSSYSTSWKKVDLNGDRKLDKITVKYSGGSGGEYKNYKLIINDKTSLALTNKWGFFKTHVNVCQLKNGQKYIFIRDEGDDNAASFCRFYRYDGKKLILAYNFDKMFGNYGCEGFVQNVSGNMITVRCSTAFKETGTFLIADYKLRPTANKKLDRSSRTGVIPKKTRSANSVRYYTLRISAKSFKTATSTKLYKTLSAGTQVRVTHIYCTSKIKRLRVVTKKGTVAWVKLSKPGPSSSNPRLFNEMQGGA